MILVWHVVRHIALYKPAGSICTCPTSGLALLPTGGGNHIAKATFTAPIECPGFPLPVLQLWHVCLQHGISPGFP